MFNESLNENDAEVKWILKTQLCNYASDAQFKSETSHGYIIKRFLDEDGLEMLNKLENEDALSLGNHSPVRGDGSKSRSPNRSMYASMTPKQSKGPPEDLEIKNVSFMKDPYKKI